MINRIFLGLLLIGCATIVACHVRAGDKGQCEDFYKEIDVVCWSVATPQRPGLLRCKDLGGNTATTVWPYMVGS